MSIYIALHDPSVIKRDPAAFSKTLLKAIESRRHEDESANFPGGRVIIGDADGSFGREVQRLASRVRHQIAGN